MRICGGFWWTGSLKWAICKFKKLKITLFNSCIFTSFPQVQESFELNHETLYTAVKMVDIYLSKKQVIKSFEMKIYACKVFQSNKFNNSMQLQNMSFIIYAFLCSGEERRSSADRSRHMPHCLQGEYMMGVDQIADAGAETHFRQWH